MVLNPDAYSLENCKELSKENLKQEDCVVDEMKISYKNSLQNKQPKSTIKSIDNIDKDC